LVLACHCMGDRTLIFGQKMGERDTSPNVSRFDNGIVLLGHFHSALKTKAPKENLNLIYIYIYIYIYICIYIYLRDSEASTLYFDF
jgi:hypothetical protein